jgi:hypothetical protein
MKDLLNNQHAWKAMAVIGAAALYWGSTLVPAAQTDARAGLLGLAGLLIGWLGMRRPVD